jgi:hypothetical protein
LLTSTYILASIVAVASSLTFPNIESITKITSSIQIGLFLTPLCFPALLQIQASWFWSNSS